MPNRKELPPLNPADAEASTKLRLPRVHGTLQPRRGSEPSQIHQVENISSHRAQVKKARETEQEHHLKHGAPTDVLFLNQCYHDLIWQKGKYNPTQIERLIQTQEKVFAFALEIAQDTEMRATWDGKNFLANIKRLIQTTDVGYHVVRITESHSETLAIFELPLLELRAALSLPAQGDNLSVVYDQLIDRMKPSESVSISEDLESAAQIYRLLKKITGDIGINDSRIQNFHRAKAILFDLDPAQTAAIVERYPEMTDIIAELHQKADLKTNPEFWSRLFNTQLKAFSRVRFGQGREAALNKLSIISSYYRLFLSLFGCTEVAEKVKDKLRNFRECNALSDEELKIIIEIEKA